MASYKYKDERPLSELEEVVRWLNGRGWKMRNRHMFHPALLFSWSLADAERLTKEAEDGNKQAQALLAGEPERKRLKQEPKTGPKNGK
ncbi:MAG: hypothetical protein E4G90_10770 [Gemmatimonadales bacterium]|nr:MAG: hypothetical protein E4G90_10770 [Gemmatimonadales bacterium]